VLWRLRRLGVIMLIAAAAAACSPAETAETACAIIPADALQDYFPEGVPDVKYEGPSISGIDGSCAWGGTSRSSGEVVIESWGELLIQWHEDGGHAYENDREHWCGRPLPLPCSHTELEGGFVRYFGEPDKPGAWMFFIAIERSYFLSASRLDDEEIIQLAERIGFAGR
jgi:hypothetical protein